MRNRPMMLAKFPRYGFGLRVTRRRSSLFSARPLAGRRAEAKAAAAAEPKPTYDPHDLTGIWRGVNAATASGRPRAR